MWDIGHGNQGHGHTFEQVRRSQIPKAIRTARRWQAGQVFAFIPKGEGMLLVPVPSSEELAGLVARRRSRRTIATAPAEAMWLVDDLGVD